VRCCHRRQRQSRCRTDRRPSRLSDWHAPKPHARPACAQPHDGDDRTARPVFHESAMARPETGRGNGEGLPRRSLSEGRGAVMWEVRFVRLWRRSREWSLPKSMRLIRDLGQRTASSPVTASLREVPASRQLRQRIRNRLGIKVPRCAKRHQCRLVRVEKFQNARKEMWLGGGLAYAGRLNSRKGQKPLHEVRRLAKIGQGRDCYLFSLLAIHPDAFLYSVRIQNSRIPVHKLVGFCAPSLPFVNQVPIVCRST
jgi:hypothetical protein